MKFEFTAFPRTQEGRGASRRMRRGGKAPGIVYGGTAAPEPIELDHNALFHALRNEAFHASILAMKLGGSTTKVLLRDVQMHPFKNEILHVDFQRVDENRRIHMKVPLHFVNGEISPAVKVSGAIVSHVTNELDISCLPKDLPEFIVVDLATLDVGHSIHVSALQLPPGVTVVLRGKVDPVVAAAVVPKAHVERGSGRRRSRRGCRSGRTGRDAGSGCAGRSACRRGEAGREGRREERRRQGQTRRRSKPSRRPGTKARRGHPGGPFCCAGNRRPRTPIDMDATIRLVVGLGNPGREHEATRHNAGFWFVDALASRLGCALAAEGRFHGRVARAGADLRLLEPGYLHEPLRARGGGAVAIFRDRARRDPGRARRARPAAG